MNDESESRSGCDVRHCGGGEVCSPGCHCAGCHRPTAGDLACREAARVARQTHLAHGQWTDAGAGMQVRLA
jgi:hypothetical protein